MYWECYTLNLGAAKHFAYFRISKAIQHSLQDESLLEKINFSQLSDKYGLFPVHHWKFSS